MHNTDLQRGAEKEGTQIQKQIFKLRSNAIFEKLIENQLRKVVAEIVTTRIQYR